MTATAAVKETKTRKMINYALRMHFFHPGKFWAVAIPAGIAACAALSAIIALPFIVI